MLRRPLKETSVNAPNFQPTKRSKFSFEIFASESYRGSRNEFVPERFLDRFQFDSMAIASRGLEPGRQWNAGENIFPIIKRHFPFQPRSSTTDERIPIAFSPRFSPILLFSLRKKKKNSTFLSLIDPLAERRKENNWKKMIFLFLVDVPLAWLGFLWEILFYKFLLSPYFHSVSRRKKFPRSPGDYLKHRNHARLLISIRTR